MQISFSQDMLAITLEDDTKTFYHLQNIVEKNFKKWIGRKNKTIIFKQESEDIQRKYFLKLLNKMYIRLNSTPSKKISEEILDSIDKSIKIVHLKSNQIQQRLKIDIKIKDNYALLFLLSGNNSILVSYLKNYFKDHLVQYRLKNNTLTIYPKSEKTAELFENLLQKEEIIGCYVEFKYDIDEIIEYKKTLRNKINRKRKFNALFSLLEDYYKVLECKSEDSFEVVRKNYLKLVKKYHPDRVTDKNSNKMAMYIKKFQNIQEAYEMIKVHFEHQRKYVA
jgi:molecular chaperone DnaJ